MPTSWRIPKSVLVALIGCATIPAAALAAPTGGIGTDPGDGGGTSPTPPTTPTGEGVFPIKGKHTYGDGLGAGRGHQGQDVFAKCGKPLVAAEAGRVRYVKYQSSAGNYVVIKAKGHDEFYAHLKAPSKLAPGDRVAAGDLIGRVGETGNASGCHLHFEMWSKPGWYRGGSVFDPLPYLKTWDKTS